MNLWLGLFDIRYFFAYVCLCVCHIPTHLADSVRVAGVGRGRFPSPVAALDSVGRCVSECVSPDEAAGSASPPQHPKLMSAAGLMSCPIHESPGEKETRCGGFTLNSAGIHKTINPLRLHGIGNKNY